MLLLFTLKIGRMKIKCSRFPRAFIYFIYFFWFPKQMGVKVRLNLFMRGRGSSFEERVEQKLRLFRNVK